MSVRVALLIDRCHTGDPQISGHPRLVRLVMKCEASSYTLRAQKLKIISQVSPVPILILKLIE
jgi:hypothetical protein